MKDKAVRILDQNRLMAISTLRSDGWPQNTLVGYAHEDLLIYFIISRQSQKLANIERDDRVSIAIGRDFDDPSAIMALSMAAHASEVRDEKQRNRETNPAFDWTLNVAHLQGVSEVEERMFAAIGANQAEASNFLGFLTGVVPMRSFFSPAHLVRLVGVKDFLRLSRARSRSTPPRPEG